MNGNDKRKDMKDILFIDAAARSDSRTRELAGYLLKKLQGNIRHAALYDMDIPQLDEDLLTWREACCAEKHFEDDYFALAKSAAAADIIVIAAPYWDLSFPAILKRYIEAISVYGITFMYADDGTPVGLCPAEQLYYVTTAGGFIADDAFGYGYIHNLFHGLCGVEKTACIKAEGLDIDGADIEGIMDGARASIDGMLIE